MREKEKLETSLHIYFCRFLGDGVGEAGSRITDYEIPTRGYFPDMREYKISQDGSSLVLLTHDAALQCVACELTSLDMQLGSAMF